MTVIKKDATQLVIKSLVQVFLRKLTFSFYFITDSVPGPGAYNPRYKQSYKHNPSFSIQGIRREKSHIYGPFAAF